MTVYGYKGRDPDGGVTSEIHILPQRCRWWFVLLLLSPLMWGIRKKGKWRKAKGEIERGAPPGNGIRFFALPPPHRRIEDTCRWRSGWRQVPARSRGARSGRLVWRPGPAVSLVSHFSCFRPVTPSIPFRIYLTSVCSGDTKNA